MLSRARRITSSFEVTPVGVTAPAVTGAVVEATWVCLLTFSEEEEEIEEDDKADLSCCLCTAEMEGEVRGVGLVFGGDECWRRSSDGVVSSPVSNEEESLSRRLLVVGERLLFGEFRLMTV